MISLSIARKYARALLRIGLNEKNHELLGKDLERMAALLRENKELRIILFSPFYRAPRRKAIARGVGEMLGLNRTTLDFISLLIERDRMDHLPAILNSYQELSDEVSQRVRVALFSAFPMSPPLVAEMKNQLESATGKKVILSTQEEPSLIGGVVTKIGNTIYDGSLKTQLLKVKENLYKE